MACRRSGLGSKLSMWDSEFWGPELRGPEFWDSELRGPEMRRGELSDRSIPESLLSRARGTGGLQMAKPVSRPECGRSGTIR